MLRILRAFAWLKWRTVRNSIERSGGRDSRDLLSRFSMASEQLAPIVLGLVMIPSMLALAGAGASAGASMAGGGPAGSMVQVLRLALLAGCALAVFSPLLFPAGGQPNTVRLLLLPIPGAVLYLGQAISTLAEPWMLLVTAMLLGVAAGLAAGGAIGAAAFGLLTGVLLLSVLAGVTLGVSAVLLRLVRSRRRAELLTLLLLLALPVLSLAPGLIHGQRGPQARVEPGRGAGGQPTWWHEAQRRAWGGVPSELYVRAVRSSAGGDQADAIRAAMVLSALAAVVHAASLVTVSRLLHSPDRSGSGRSSGAGDVRVWRVPGVSPATSAVAVNQVRLALRTPRGRFSLLSPVVMFVTFAVVILRSQTGEMELGFMRLPGGIGLAAFVSGVALLAILPLAMNQFAIDGAGLTLMMLTPLDAAALLRGKAIGNALIAAMPAGVCLAGSLLLFPPGEPALWLGLPLALASTYLLLAPGAAALSMLFPRVVNLNSIGRGSNAHGVAVLLGILLLGAAAGVCVLLVVAAIDLLQRPLLAPLFLLLWTGVCGAADIALFRAVASLYARRREQLGLLVR
jgi:hypothetical protein